MALMRWSPTRWDPFGELSPLQERMSRLFEDMLPSTEKGEEELNAGTFYPAVDIIEGDKEVNLRAELPGMKKEDVHVEVNDDTITLRGERKIEKEDKKQNYHRIERCYGNFNRSFTLPTNVDCDKITARYEDGILEIIIPKIEEAKPKSVQIEVN